MLALTALTALTMYCSCFESLQFLGCNRFRRLNALRESVQEPEVQGIWSSLERKWDQSQRIKSCHHYDHDTGVSTNKLCYVWCLVADAILYPVCDTMLRPEWIGRDLFRLGCSIFLFASSVCFILPSWWHWWTGLAKNWCMCFVSNDIL